MIESETVTLIKTNIDNFYKCYKDEHDKWTDIIKTLPLSKSITEIADSLPADTKDTTYYIMKSVLSCYSRSEYSEYISALSLSALHGDPTSIKMLLVFISAGYISLADVNGFLNSYNHNLTIEELVQIKMHTPHPDLDRKQ